MAGPVPVERTGSPIRDTANYLVVVSNGGTGKPTVCAHADLKVTRTFGLDDDAVAEILLVETWP